MNTLNELLCFLTAIRLEKYDYNYKLFIIRIVIMIFIRTVIKTVIIIVIMIIIVIGTMTSSNYNCQYDFDGDCDFNYDQYYDFNYDFNCDRDCVYDCDNLYYCHILKWPSVCNCSVIVVTAQVKNVLLLIISLFIKHLI